MTIEHHLTEILFADPVKGEDFKLYLYGKDGFHGGPIWFTSGRIRYRFMLLGASIAACIMQLLLSFGGVVLSRELQKLDGVYGTFAIVLGLFFWMYLLSQVVMYAAEVDTVRHFHLWPRSLSGKLPTEPDKHAYRLYAQSEKYIEKENIGVRFR